MAADGGKDGFGGNCSIIGTRVRKLRPAGKRPGRYRYAKMPV